jgi:hypothetical protein
MKKQKIVLGLQGLVSGYTLLHHDEQEADSMDATPSKSAPRPSKSLSEPPTKK